MCLSQAMPDPLHLALGTLSLCGRCSAMGLAIAYIIIDCKGPTIYDIIYGLALPDYTLQL